ncbi:ANKRD17 family protein [Megaselia abdita]
MKFVRKITKNKEYCLKVNNKKRINNKKKMNNESDKTEQDEQQQQHQTQQQQPPPQFVAPLTTIKVTRKMMSKGGTTSTAVSGNTSATSLAAKSKKMTDKTTTTDEIASTVSSPAINSNCNTTTASNTNTALLQDIPPSTAIPSATACSSVTSSTSNEQKVNLKVKKIVALKSSLLNLANGSRVAESLKSCNARIINKTAKSGRVTIFKSNIASSSSPSSAAVPDQQHQQALLSTGVAPVPCGSTLTTPSGNTTTHVPVVSTSTGTTTTVKNSKNLNLNNIALSSITTSSSGSSSSSASSSSSCSSTNSSSSSMLGMDAKPSNNNNNNHKANNNHHHHHHHQIKNINNNNKFVSDFFGGGKSNSQKTNNTITASNKDGNGSANGNSDNDVRQSHHPAATTSDCSESEDEDEVSDDDIPESDPDSANDEDGNDDEDDGDDEISEEDIIPEQSETCGKYLLESADVDPNFHQISASDKSPYLRYATHAIDETKQALTKMRCPRDKSNFSKTLISACTGNDVNTVKRLLGSNKNFSLNETDDGESLLSMACSAGYVELAQVLLQTSAAQVEDKGQKDCTPLMEAASAGHLDIVKLLIAHNADVNAQCATGNTPLMFSCASGHVEVVKELLKHGANVEDQNENGHTPLMEAASAGHVEVAKVLLEHGAGINTHSNEFKESALTLACYKGHLYMVRFLLQAGADQEHKTDEMHTALMEASMDGHVEVARLLLDSGAQVNMPTDSFESPLTLAACGGHVELATLLIERGANIEEVNDEGYTPLMEAAREGHEDMVALLLTKGANINAATEETQETALTLACCGGFTEVVEFLIKQGADLELGASTPLMEAAQEGHTDLVRFLLENGANVHAVTQTGDTALTHACENGHTDAAEVLLYYGAELEHESEGGRTPLMKACRAGHSCTVTFLIGKGALVNKQTTSNDHTPLSLACVGGHQAVVEYLLKSGADPFHKLKDNSTMLIEAAKGGHIRVVELLFKYPDFMTAAVQKDLPLPSANSAQRFLEEMQTCIQLQHKLNHIGAATTSDTIQQQQPQPPQDSNQFQLISSGRLDKEPIQIPNLHILGTQFQLQQQQLQQPQPSESFFPDEQRSFVLSDISDQYIQEQCSDKFKEQQEEELISKIRIFHYLICLKFGFRESIQQMLQPISDDNAVQSAKPISNLSSKLKNVLRRNRQLNVPFDLNFAGLSMTNETAYIAPSTSNSPPKLVRSQPLGDENAAGESELEDSIAKNNLLQNYFELGQSVNSPQANQAPYCCINDSMNHSALNGTNPIPMGMIPVGAHMPSTSFEIDTTTYYPEDGSFVIGKPKSSSNDPPLTNYISRNFYPPLKIPYNMNRSDIKQTSYIKTKGSSTQLTTPSEVSQSTAISDRPKAKPVSKKDGKNSRKVMPNQLASGVKMLINQSQDISKTFNNMPLLNSTVSNNSSMQHPIVNSTKSLITLPPSIEDQPQQFLLKLNSSTTTTSTVITSSISDEIPKFIVPNSHNSVAEFFDEVNDRLDTNDLTAYGKLDFTREINANVYRHILGVKENIKHQHPKSPETPPPSSQIHQDQIQECKKQFAAFQQSLQQQRPYAIPTSVISGSKRSKNSSSLNVKIPKLPEAASNSGASSEGEYDDEDDEEDEEFIDGHEDHSENQAGDEELEDTRNGADEDIDDEDEEDDLEGDDEDDEDEDDVEEDEDLEDEDDEESDEEDDEDEITEENPEDNLRKLPECLEILSNVALKPDEFTRALSEMRTTELVQVFPQITNFISQKPQQINIPQQIGFQNGKNQGTYSHEEHFRMYHPVVDQLDEEALATIYPALDESFNTDGTINVDVGGDCEEEDESKNYEFGFEGVEEFLNVFQNCGDSASMPDCPEFAEFTSMNSFCKTRWNGTGLLNQLQQWMLEEPQYADDTQHQQQKIAANIVLDAPLQRLSDSSASSQAQEDLTIYSNNTGPLHIQQPTTQQQQIHLPLIPITSEQALTEALRNENDGDIALPTITNTTNEQLEGDVLSQEQPLDLSRGQPHSSTSHLIPGVNEDGSLIFDVDAGRTSPRSLQFLFQLPNVQQSPNQHQSQQQQIQQQVIVKNHTISSNSVDANCQQKNITQPNINLHQQDAITYNYQQQLQQALATQQVQVATQTQQLPNAVIRNDKNFLLNVSEADTQNLAMEVAQQMQQQNINLQHRSHDLNVLRQQGGQQMPMHTTPANMPQQPHHHHSHHPAQIGSVTTTSTSKAFSGIAKKAIDKPTRKERKHFTVVRQTPAGSQVNTTQHHHHHIQPQQQYQPPPQPTVSSQPTATIAPTASQPPLPTDVNAAAGIDKTIDVDSETDSNHDTALTLACAGGHEELVELLISRNADIEHRDKKGFTPLILAATAGHQKVVDILLKHGAQLEAQSERTKDTPLSLACSGGRYEVVELLLNYGANKEHRNVSDYTPLSLAASGGYVNIINLLLRSGAEINSRTGSKLGISPLMLAAMNGHTAAVKLLLDQGSDINAQIETNRNTALTLACFQGRHEVVRLLLDRKANVEHRAKTGLTPLMEAASGGYIDVGRVLLDKGADVNAAPVPTSRDTALTIAADKGHLKFVELLLQRGAAVEVKNKKGNSPLWLAAHGGHNNVVEILYQSCADIDSQDNKRVSCLMAAFRKGHTKVVKWMVQHVTQLPSDQEMASFINTITDKDLLEKLYDCIKIIRHAKEEQAIEANKNASILLEILDREKNREESRKAAAARRRERKKKKKLEKKEEKRRAMGEETKEKNKDDDESDKDDDEDEPNADEDDEIVLEGDSGIDQGSCSSAGTTVPPPESTKTKNKNKKNKNKKENVAPIPKNQSPTRSQTPAEPENVEKKPKKKDDKEKKLPSKEEKEKKVVVSEKPVKKEKVIAEKAITTLKNSSKENVPKEIEKKLEPTATVSTTTPSTSYSSTGSRKSMVFTASKDSKSSNLLSKRAEDGWKEVVGKSSIKQTALSTSITSSTNSSSTGGGSSASSTSGSSEMTCKKVQVPVNAISRVIGRAGSNINAIRATTGAYIEVEKQGKNQSERSITIKGSVEAVKQAHILIATLIKDPDVDILQMLPKVNPNAKIVPPLCSSLPTKVSAIVTKVTPVVTIATSIAPVTSVAVSVASKPAIVRSQTAVSKPVFKASTVTTVSTTVAGKTVRSNSSLSSNDLSTKTTMTYTNAIMSQQKNAASKPTSSATGPNSTFAAKLNATPNVVDKKPSQQTPPIGTFTVSPKKHISKNITPNPLSGPIGTFDVAEAAAYNAAAALAAKQKAVQQQLQAAAVVQQQQNQHVQQQRSITPNQIAAPQAIQSVHKCMTPPLNSSAMQQYTQQSIAPVLPPQIPAMANSYSLFCSVREDRNLSLDSILYGDSSEADASKAPGYNRNIISSPVSSKTSSNSTTPSSAGQEKVIENVNNGNEIPSALAIQRPTNRNAADNFGPIGSQMHQVTQPSTTQSQPTQQQPQPQATMQPPHMSPNSRYYETMSQIAAHNHGAPGSRLNPRASVFNQNNNKMNGNNASGNAIFNHQNPNGNPNAFVNKAPQRPQSQNHNHQQQAIQQQQRWMDYTGSFISTGRDLNVENIPMNVMGASVISPAALSPNGQPNGSIQINAIQQNPNNAGSADADMRKIPRPIGIERAAASWKYNSFQMPLNNLVDMVDNVGVSVTGSTAPGMPWVMDKQPNQTHQQTQPQPNSLSQHQQTNWSSKQQPQPQFNNFYGSEYHQPEMFHVPLEYQYQNSAVGSSVAVGGMNMMPNFQYPQQHFISPDLGPQPISDKLDWDHEKQQHSWPSMWTN